MKNQSTGRHFPTKIAILLFILLASCSNIPLSGTKNNPQKQLKTLFKWFQNHPPGIDETGQAARWERSKILDQYGWELDTKSWKAYRTSWSENPVDAARLETEYPILWYLRHTSNQSIREIKKTKIASGVVLWKFYNMGYVIKTRDVCFGIDLVSPGLEELIDYLDFTIVSHSHHDHIDIPFLNAMIQAGRTVFSPFYSDGTVISSTQEFNYGEVKVRFTMNDQKGTPLIVSEINCGESADNYTIFHIADSRIPEKLTPTQKVDLLVLHISNAINIFDVIDRVKPKATAFDHVMEMGHPVGQYRWSYDYTYNKIKSVPPNSGYVLTWGERLEN